jgi:hypothetical protein
MVHGFIRPSLKKMLLYFAGFNFLKSLGQHFSGDIMKRTILSALIISAFFFGCCCHKKCIKDDHQAQKSKIEAQKAMDEMDQQKTKDNSQ